MSERRRLSLASRVRVLLLHGLDAHVSGTRRASSEPSARSRWAQETGEARKKRALLLCVARRSRRRRRTRSRTSTSSACAIFTCSHVFSISNSSVSNAIVLSLSVLSVCVSLLLHGFYLFLQVLQPRLRFQGAVVSVHHAHKVPQPVRRGAAQQRPATRSSQKAVKHRVRSQQKVCSDEVRTQALQSDRKHFDHL